MRFGDIVRGQMDRFDECDYKVVGIDNELVDAGHEYVDEDGCH